MSTENEEYTLVHEDYIDEHQIDESELPQNVQNAILAIDMIDDGNYFAYINSKSGYLWGVNSKGVEQF